MLTSLEICHIGSRFGLYGDIPHDFYAEVKEMEKQETGAEWIIRLQDEKALLQRELDELRAQKFAEIQCCPSCCFVFATQKDEPELETEL